MNVREFVKKRSNNFQFIFRLTNTLSIGADQIWCTLCVRVTSLHASTVQADSVLPALETATTDLCADPLVADFVLETIRVGVGTLGRAEAPGAHAGGAAGGRAGALLLQGLTLHYRVAVQTRGTRAQGLVVGRAALGIGTAVANCAGICRKR